MVERFTRSFTFNLIVVLLICIVLYVLFFVSLRFITHHGQELKIPDVVGSNIKTAIVELKGADFDVYVDSTFDPKLKPLAVISQMPEKGSVVKPGRMVFLTVNKMQPPLTKMPDLINKTYRSAEMLLRNNNLLVGDTTYKPDIADGAVLAQTYNGADIRPGDLVPEGSHINLVIGNGLGNVEFNVPQLIGLPYDQAMANLAAYNLLSSVVNNGDITDTANATVIDQTPKPQNALGAPNRIKAGDIIDLRIMQNPAPGDIKDNKESAAPVDSQSHNP